MEDRKKLLLNSKRRELTNLELKLRSLLLEMSKEDINDWEIKSSIQNIKQSIEQLEIK